MSDGLSLTADRPTQPAEEACAPDPVDAGSAPADVVEVRDPVPVPVPELPAAAPAGSDADRPPVGDTLVDRIRADAREQWDELTRLVEAVREWSPTEWVAAARERLPSACRAPFARGATTGPAADGVAVVPVPPTLPSRWSAVVPERSALATHRHTVLLSPLPDDSAPRPRRPRPVLSAGLAVLLAGNAVGALQVVGTDQQVRAPDNTAAVVAAAPVRASAVPATSAPRISPSPAAAAPPAATPSPATAPTVPTTPPRAAVPVRPPAARPAPPRRTSTATSSTSTSTKSNKKKRHR